MPETRAVTLANIASSDAFTVDNANDRVGIGSTVPDATLDIKNTVIVDGVAGVVTAIAFDGDGSRLTGVANTDVIVSSATTTGRLVVNNDATVSGVTTAGGVILKDTNIVAGVVTGSTFVGDGSGLTGVANTDVVHTREITASGVSTFSGNVNLSGANITLQDSGGASDDRLTFGAGTDLSIYHDGSNSRIVDSGSGELRIDSNSLRIRNAAGTETSAVFTEDGSVVLRYDNVTKLETSSSGVTLGDGLLLDNATNAGRDVQWQPANDRLVFLDNTKATFGNEIDLSIYHNGSASYIDETGTGALYVRGSDLYLTDEDGTNMLYAANNAGVSLYYGGSVKLATNSDGISFGDNVKLRLGDAPDYKIYHNGSHTYHENYTGDLYIKSDQMYLMSWTSGEQYLHAVKDGRVALFYDNVIKLQTNGTDGVILANTTDDANYTNALTLTRRGYETSGYGVRIQAKGGSASGQNGLRFKISDGSGSNYTSRFSFTNDGLLFNSDTSADNALND